MTMPSCSWFTVIVYRRTLGEEEELVMGEEVVDIFLVATCGVFMLYKLKYRKQSVHLWCGLVAWSRCGYF
jgi:hypothetical protein